MRRVVDRERLLRFMRELGRLSHVDARIYLTGGSSAVLLDWRRSTIDVDLEIRPEKDEILRVIPALKEQLEINVEPPSPGHFIPEPPGWEERSVFISRGGKLDFFHYDFYAQALSKLERSHVRDRDDVRAMRQAGLIDPAKLVELYEIIEPQLFRYPALDPRSFRAAVQRFAK